MAVENDNENEETLAKEQHVARVFAERLGWTEHKLSKYDHIDFRMSKDNKTVAFLEARSRSHDFGTYDPLFIAEDKWQSMLNVGMGFNVPVYFAFYFTDGVYFFDVMSHGQYNTGYAKGRSNRTVKRVTDYEKVVNVYVNKLIPLKIDNLIK
jgi:hypothetical protein